MAFQTFVGRRGMRPVPRGKLPLARTIGAAFAVLLTAFAAKAGAVVPGKAIEPPSLAERVAAIRAKAAQLSAASTHDTAASSLDQPAQIAWNDWKNE